MNPPGYDKFLSSNSNVITVYDDPRWIKSMLRLDIKQRLNAKRFHHILKQSYPEIFLDLKQPDFFLSKKIDIESETEIQRLKRLSFSSGHVNWEDLFRSNHSFQNMFNETVKSLANRKIIDWFDPLEYSSLINNDPTGHGKIIWLLPSLEVNIRAGLLPS